MKIKVSDYIVQRLYKAGVKTIFGYQGGNISHLIDSIGNHPDIQFVETCNEQGASFAANSYSQLNETIGVAVASSGPGAINLLSGVANAFCDSIPCIFFTGDVNTTAKNVGSSKRQNAFQEIDIVPMVETITKYSVSLNDENDVVEVLDKAIEIALSGRKGPVLINLPHDIQRNYIEVDDVVGEKKFETNLSVDGVDICVEELKKSKRPVVLLGGGLKSKEGTKLIKSLLKKIEIPVVASLLGLDVLPHSHSCYRGFIGIYGNRAANLCLIHADFILVLGSRIDDRQLSSADAKLFKDKSIVHIDIDENELKNKLKHEKSINGDVYAFLRLLVNSDFNYEFSDWMEKTRLLLETFPNYKFGETESHPNVFLNELSRKESCIYTFDVGNNQMHSAQSVYINENSHALSSGGLGSMGYSLPASIGACYAIGVHKVCCITGDGGLQMNIQELQTISEHNLPVNIVVLNNDALGMIYHLQTKIFKDRFYGTTDGYGSPNLEMIAQAYGFKYVRVDKRGDYKNVISNLINGTRYLVDFKMDVKTSPYPDISGSIFSQLPKLTENEIELINKIIDK